MSSNHRSGSRSPTDADVGASLGCSLPTAFVAGLQTRFRLGLHWSNLYRTFHACTESLRSLGVSVIELHDVGPQSNPEVLRAAMLAVRDAGMAISVHAWLPEAPSELRPLAATIEQTGVAGGRPVPCVLHAHPSGPEGTREDALDATVASLGALCRELHRIGSVLEPTIELARIKPGGPVGTSFAELLAIHDAIAMPNLRICWEMGHVRSNDAAGASEEPPTVHFIAAVGHTHIHDLDERGRTHGPIRSTEGPVADQVRTLVRSGYRGPWILELKPSRWGGHARPARESVERSFRLVRQLLDTTPAAARS